MRVNVDVTNPVSDDSAGAKFDVAVANAQAADPQMSDLIAKGMVSVMGNFMMKLAGDALSDGQSDDE